MNSSRSKLELLMIKYFEKNLITFFRHVLTNKASQKRPPPLRNNYYPRENVIFIYFSKDLQNFDCCM